MASKAQEANALEGLSFESSELIVGKESEEWFAGLKRDELLKIRDSESNVSPVSLLLLVQEYFTYSLDRTVGDRPLHVSRDIE